MHASWYRVTPDGRYLYYETLAAGHTPTITAFELETQVTTTLSFGFLPPGESDWVTVGAFLSAGGQHLVVPLGPESRQVAEIERGAYKVRQLASFDPPLFATMDLEWSPTARQFLLGVADHRPVEAGPALMRYLYLIDVATGKVTRLAAAAAGSWYEDFYYKDSYAWSPDGRRVAIREGPALCIITVATTQQECLSATQPGPGADTYAGSPSGRYIAFKEHLQDEISLFEPETRKLMPLLHGITALEGMDWR